MHFMTRFIWTAVIVVCCVAEARADVIFSNLGPGGAFDDTQFYSAIATIDGSEKQSLAMAFTPTANYIVTGASWALSSTSADPITQILIDNDNGGKPGINLGGFGFGLVSSTPSVVNSTLVGSVIDLAAGQQYWMEIGAFNYPNSFSWYYNSTGQTGPVAMANETAGGAWNVAPGTEAAFAVYGTPLAPTVPEPSTLTLLGISAICTIGYARRRQSRLRHERPFRREELFTLRAHSQSRIPSLSPPTSP
jgi:PEP-CTERM motif